MVGNRISVKKAACSKKKNSGLNKLENEVKQVLKNERKIISEEKRIESKEKNINRLQKREIKEEKKIEREGESEICELKKLEDMEKKLKSTESVILRKVTYHDFIKSAIGAFAGVVGSFAFALAPGLFLEISLLRAHMLLLFSFAIVVIFVYFSGFRKVREIRNLGLLPLRAIVIYATALATVIFVFAIFGLIGHYGLADVYRLISATSILAVLGACAADMIGGQ